MADFKRIETLGIDLKPITSLVGDNTSGKSSALQAAQPSVSTLQAARRGARNGDLHPANDAEHSSANPEHLKAVFGNLPAEIVEATVRDAIQEKRDVLVLAVQKAREQIAGSLHDSEWKKGKPEWAAAGLAQDAPKVKDVCQWTATPRSRLAVATAKSLCRP